MLKVLLAILLVSLIDIIISIDVTCNINGGTGCCSLCTAYPSPCNMSFCSDVTSIDDSAFWACYQLTSVIIPNTILSLGSNSFAW